MHTKQELGKLAKIIISGSPEVHCAHILAGIILMDPKHGLYASKTTLSEPKNWLTKLESGKLAKIMIFGPLEAYCALILAGIILMDPQHDST